MVVKDCITDVIFDFSHSATLTIACVSIGEIPLICCSRDNSPGTRKVRGNLTDKVLQV